MRHRGELKGRQLMADETQVTLMRKGGKTDKDRKLRLIQNKTGNNKNMNGLKNTEETRSSSKLNPRNPESKLHNTPSPGRDHDT